MKALSGDISYLVFVPSVSSQPGDKYGYNILQWFSQGNNPLIFMLRAANGSKEWTGKTIYLNFSSIFGDFFLKFFEEEVSDYLS